MAKNVKVAGATYLGVTGVELPLSTGNGVAKFVDTSSDTVTKTVLVKGYTAHDASGNQITGEATIGERLLSTIITASSAGEASLIVPNVPSEPTRVVAVKNGVDGAGNTTATFVGYDSFASANCAVVPVRAGAMQGNGVASGPVTKTYDATNKQLTITPKATNSVKGSYSVIVFY